jgi:hypothetical protein
MMVREKSLLVKCSAGWSRRCRRSKPTSKSGEPSSASVDAALAANEMIQRVGIRRIAHDALAPGRLSALSTVLRFPLREGSGSA